MVVGDDVDVKEIGWKYNEEQESDAEAFAEIFEPLPPKKGE